MKTKAVRLYGVNDLRLEEFELPEITDSEILAHVISDSICMSTYKAASQGTAHKRVPDDIADSDTIFMSPISPVAENIHTFVLLLYACLDFSLHIPKSVGGVLCGIVKAEPCKVSPTI